jgi:hypothetical protein
MAISHDHQSSSLFRSSELASALSVISVFNKDGAIPKDHRGILIDSDGRESAFGLGDETTNVPKRTNQKGFRQV